MRFRLERVQHIPAVLEPGVLYVAEAFGAAAHLCACGCGDKVRTPLTATEWQLEESPFGPTLWPSIGRSHHPCGSHYWIRDGEVHWAPTWTQKEIVAGRSAEERRRKEYFDRDIANTPDKLTSFKIALSRLLQLVRAIFRRKRK